MKIWLKELDKTDGKEFYDVLMELTDIENVYARPVPEKFGYDDFSCFLESRVRMANNDNLPKNIIPTNTYWVMDDNDIIGYATLKHYADLDNPGGHTGLVLLPSYQNKGIGSIVAYKLEMIALNEMGIDNLIYTSKNENIQSQKSIEKIGGNLVHIKNGYHFYQVDLLKKYERDEYGFKKR